MDRGPDGANWHTRFEASSWICESHLAVGVDRPTAQVREIAQRAGWPAGQYDRAGFFKVARCGSKERS